MSKIMKKINSPNSECSCPICKSYLLGKIDNKSSSHNSKHSFKIILTVFSF